MAAAYGTSEPGPAAENPEAQLISRYETGEVRGIEGPFSLPADERAALSHLLRACAASFRNGMMVDAIASIERYLENMDEPIGNTGGDEAVADVHAGPWTSPRGRVPLAQVRP
jgi:hypothetical protein